jgi:mannitol/fructose-specific phosphotransferase system IIA component (Ntr-type)
MALVDRIEERIVKVPLESATRDGVIDELVGVLWAAGLLSDREAARAAVMEREAKGSTGLAEGVAVPHGKTPAVKDLAIAIGVSREGVDFGALDGQASRLFFLIMAPPDKAGPHIEALAEIARMARSKAFCRALSGARDAAELVELLRSD